MFFIIIIFNTESNKRLFYKEEKRQVEYKSYEGMISKKDWTLHFWILKH